MKNFLQASIASVVLALGLVGVAPAEAGTINRKVDFDTTPDGAIQDLAPGTIISDQWDDWGLNISVDPEKSPGVNSSKYVPDSERLTLFDSDCLGNTCSGGDPDLATGSNFGTASQGNVLIIQETWKNGNEGTINRDRDENGLYTTPDDDLKGGTITFDFSQNPNSNIFENFVRLNTVALLDLDDAASGFPTLTAYFLNDQGQEDTKQLTLSDYQIGGDDVTLISDNPGNNSLWEFDFGGLDQVYQLDVDFPSSGAIAYVEYDQKTVEPEEVPEPATALSLLVLGVLGTGSMIKRKQS